MRFTVDENRCTLCGACLLTCPTDMVREKRGAIKISYVACIGCGHCQAVCPEEAISLREIEYEGDFTALPDAVASPEALLGLLQSRRSVRCYESRPVERAEVEAVLEAARWIPTAANCQCQQFTVLTSPEMIEELREGVMAYYREYAEALADRDNPRRREAWGQAAGAPMHEHILAAVPSLVKNVAAGRERLFFEAPVVVLIHSDRGEVLPEVACAHSALVMTLMAQARGLGTCITAYASLALQALPRLAGQLGVPENHEVYQVVVMGYPAEVWQLCPPRRPLPVQWR